MYTDDSDASYKGTTIACGFGRVNKNSGVQWRFAFTQLNHQPPAIESGEPTETRWLISLWFLRIQNLSKYTIELELPSKPPFKNKPGFHEML